MPQITIQLKLESALSIRTDKKNDPEIQFLSFIDKAGAKLMPMHPDSTHSLLVPFFTIEIPDSKIADQFIIQLRKYSIVESAYIKPEPELPNI
jgi:hypothetical protein